jgi:hypothetical protein
LPGAQTERRDGAGPVMGLLGGTAQARLYLAIRRGCTAVLETAILSETVEKSAWLLNSSSRPTPRVFTSISARNPSRLRAKKPGALNYFDNSAGTSLCR